MICQQIIINAPIKRIWRAFSQIEEWPRWSGYIINAYWTSNEKWKRGSRFVQIISGIGPIRRKSYPIVVEVKQNEYARWRGTGKLIQGVHTLEFKDIGKNKTFVANKEFFRGILAPIIFPLIKKRFEGYFQQFLEGLKRECEKSLKLRNK